MQPHFPTRWRYALLWLAGLGWLLYAVGGELAGPADYAPGLAGQYRIVRAAHWLDAGPALPASVVGPPRPAAAWQAVALPHRLSARQDSARLHWYRIVLADGAWPGGAGQGAPALCVPRWSASASVWLDGQLLLASAPGLHGMRDYSRPQFIGLPPALAPGPHRLEIGVRALPGLAPGLSELWLGDGALIRHACQVFAESRHERALGATLVMATLGLAGLGLALLLRDQGAACFTLMTALWIVHFGIASNSFRGISEHAWSLLFFATRTAFFVPMFLFCLRFANVRRPWLERTLVLAYLLALGLLLMLPPSAWSLWTLAMGVTLMTASLYFLGVLVRHALRAAGVAGSLLAAAFTFVLVATVVDMGRVLGWTAFGGGNLSFIAVPLLSLAFGALLIERLVRFTRDAAASADTLRATVARQHARIAADYAVLQAQGERLAVLEERRRIVRDMHDGVGSQLVSASAMLKSAQAMPRQQVTELVDDALLALRSVLDVLSAQPATHPDDDPVSTLLGSLRWRIAPVLESQGITLGWHADALPADFLPADGTRLQLLRLLQESFANVVKHAGASHVAFRSEVRDGAVVIEVRDNGCGLDWQRAGTPGTGTGAGTGAAPGEARFGMAAMHERAARLGAQLRLTDAAPGTAVTLRFALPLPLAASR